MKTVLFILLLGSLSYSANAQQKYKLPEGVMPNVPLVKNPRGLPAPSYRMPMRDSTISFPWQSRVKPGVYSLPQDNMPCIVPNTSGIAKMPNASPVTLPFVGSIPNASPLPAPVK